MSLRPEGDALQVGKMVHTAIELKQSFIDVEILSAKN